jgi:hypothetical protein
MKNVEQRIYDASGKLVYASRSNDGLEADELFPGPGGGMPRAFKNGVTPRASQSAWPFHDDGRPRVND